jgi:hypothetical protein
MRRALIGLAGTAFAVLALAGPASAAPGQVTQVRFNGTFAEVFWSTSSATSFTNFEVNVSTSKQGSELYVDHFTGNLNAMGNFTGGTDTFADVATGFSFAIDKTHLTSASTSGSGLPAMTCSVDVSGNESGCSATTMDVTVTWTGQGPITRAVLNQRFKSSGFSVTDHSSGTDRAAAATGTVAGSTLGASELVFADLGFTNSGTITRCIGLSC